MLAKSERSESDPSDSPDHGRVTMKIIAMTNATVAKLQKVCIHLTVRALSDSYLLRRAWRACFQVAQVSPINRGWQHLL
jgi:hypothetical protein